MKKMKIKQRQRQEKIMIKWKIKMVIKLMKIKNQIANRKLSLSLSFSLYTILSLLDIKIPENASTLTQFSFSVFLLSLVSFLCFLNIIFFLIVYIFLQNKTKFSCLNKLINYYKNISLFYVLLEAVICTISLLLLIIFSFSYFWLGIKEINF
jgi:hypothetical protein